MDDGKDHGAGTVDQREMKEDHSDTGEGRAMRASFRYQYQKMGRKECLAGANCADRRGRVRHCVSIGWGCKAGVGMLHYHL